MARSARPAPATPAPRASVRAFVVWCAVTLVVLLALGLAARVQPFTWDQAVFALGAQAMDRGAVLYRDYWDFKQPGIFAFFWLAGRAFGFDEAGAHTLELAWMLALAAGIAWRTRAWFARPTSAAWAPLFVCGFYFAVATDWHLLQVEGLVSLPLFVALWPPATRSARPAVARPFAAGVAGGVALTFKLAFVPLLALVWMHSAWTAAPDGAPGRAGRALRELAWRALGVAVVVGAVGTVFVARGAWSEAWWTWTVFPLQVLRSIPEFPWASLRRTGMWLATTWWPLLVLAAVGLVASWRRPQDDTVRALTVWLAGAVLVILMQRWSGYEFHAWLLLVPLGLLAARGAEAAVLATRAWPLPGARALAVAGVLLVGSSPILHGARRVTHVARSGAWGGPARVEAMRDASTQNAYRDYERLASVAGGPSGSTGPIVVFGNPLAYWVMGRPPASSYPVAMSVYGEPQWNRIAEDIARVRPAWVLVEDPAVAMLQRGRPATAGLLSELTRHYRTGPRVGPAVWLERVTD